MLVTGRTARIHLLEALAAIHRAVAARLERHAGLAATVGADGAEEFAAGAGITIAATGLLLLARGAAFRAAGGVVGEAAAGEEFLLAHGEEEVIAAVAATQGHVSSQSVCEPFCRRIAIPVTWMVYALDNAWWSGGCNASGG
jgi:hypothetical protein